MLFYLYSFVRNLFTIVIYLNIIQMLPNKLAQNCNLPPGCQNNQIEYTLNLTLSSVQLLQISPRPVMIKLQMWGLDNQNRIYEDGKMGYNIRTNLQLFRNYLRDMKITALKLCDVRNNQQLGTGLINWIIYMRKVDIKTSPFLQNIFDVTVPIVNHKKKHIAQIKMIVQWSVYTKSKSIHSIRDNLSEVAEEGQGQREYNYFNTNQVLGRKNNLVQKQQIKKKNKLSPVSKVQHEQQQQSFNANIFPKTQTKLSLYNKNRKQQNFGQFTLNQVQDKQIRYPDSKYQLQKAKLRLQAEQFITLTKKQTNFNTFGNKIQNFITVRINDLIINKPNLSIEYLDIFIISKKQEIQRKNMRIFPIVKQSNNYVAEISIRDRDSIQIQLPKGLGKATVQSKLIVQKQSTKLFIYGKTGKLGTILLTKISDSDNKKEQKYLQSIQQQIRQKPMKLDKKQKYNSIKSSSNSIVINKKAQQSPLPTIYFLITIHQVKHYQYGQFEVAIKNYTFTKPYPTFSIIPMSDLGSIFAIQFRNNSNETIDSTYVENYAKIPIVQQSLGCVVLVNGRVDLERGFVRVEIMMGTMKQINYQLARQNKYRNVNPYIQVERNAEGKKKKLPKQQIQNYHNNTQNRQQNNQLNTKNQSIDSSKLKQQQIEVPIKKRRTNRKMYSQYLATDQQRVATEPNYKYTNQLIEQEQKLENQQENVWLVQILSKFLHALPPNKFSQTPPTTVQQFINLLLHFLTNREQKQLIQLVIDMFIDDISIEQGQPQRLEYEQFLKCLKSYHNFLQLWWKMRVDILSQVIKLQPDYINKITQYSELGTISKQVLWKKALHKVDNPELQLKIDKILKFNTGTTISSQYLIDQFKRIQSAETQIQKQATPDLIVDLGKLIKQTIQSILQGSGILPPSVVEDRVNIRILCDIFEKINVSLSYWEALMLIEQLKGWYNVDLQLNQGIVSGSVIQVWIKSVLNRSKDSSYIGGLSPAEGDQKQRESVQRQPTSNKNQIKKDVQVVVNNPQKVLEHTPSQRMTHRISENKSVVKSQLNQQQIFNIANLLRDNEHFRLGTVSSQKPPSKVFNNLSASHQNITQNQGNGKPGNMSKILNDDILNQSRQESHLSEQSPENKKTQPIKKEQSIDKTPKYLLTKIKSIKIKKQLIYPIKISMRIYSTKQHYFLIKDIQQIEGKQFVQQLTYNWHRQSKGLTVQLIKIKQNQSQSKYEQKSEILIYGILVNDQIMDLYKKQQTAKTKTIVLYGNKQILGKITLQVQILNKPPQTFFCQKSINIQLQINPDLKHDNQWKVFMIKTISISSLTNKNKENEQQQSIGKPILIQKCTKQKLEMKGTFYKEILVVVVEGIGNCNVPLQELYLKSQIVGQYPVLNQQGLYLGNLQIKLSNPNNILKIQNPTTNLNTIQKQAPLQQFQQTITSKYLLIFDTITTLCKPPPQKNLQILCNIFVKDAINRTILYRSPFYVEHEHGNGQVIHHSFVSEFSSDNYCVVQDSKIRNKAITIQLEYQGRHLGISDSIIKLKDFGVQNMYQTKNNKNKCRVCYQLKYPQNTSNQTLLRIGVRLIPIPSSFQKYNVKRIYKTLSKHKYQQQLTQDRKIDQLISDSTKLAITEQRLLKQIVELSNGVIFSNWILPEQKYLELLEQFIFSDSQFTGRLGLQQVTEILTQILPQKSQQILKYYLETHQELSQSIDYISLLQYTNRIENRTMNMSESKNENQLDRQIIKNVDKIYQEIKRKYAIK